jgi:hypothetical protein
VLDVVPFGAFKKRDPDVETLGEEQLAPAFLPGLNCKETK